MKEIQVGYRAYNGYIFTEIDCALYNAQVKRIQSFEIPPEYLLNGAHNLFTTLCLKKYL